MIKRFAKTAIIYGFSTAINKGLMLLALPILGSVLSLEEYGLWSLSQILISLCAPVLSLNSSAGIIREGVEDEAFGFHLFVKYSKIVFFLTILVVLPLLFLPRTWLWFTVLLMVIEAFQITLLGWYRARDMHLSYFIVVLLKLIVLIIAVVFMGSSANLENLLAHQVIFGSLLLAPFYFKELFAKAKETRTFIIKPVFLFSLMLIPHGVAQWVLSGADRLVIKHLLHDIELGKYSLAYSLAMVLLILNSGLALTLPNYIINNYGAWVEGFKKVKILAVYSFFSIAVGLFLVFCIEHFYWLIPLLKDMDADIKGLIIWLVNGIYLLGVYLFYVNILFFHKRAKIISFTTLIIAVLNLIATYFLVDFMGIQGAAITTFVSYLLYLVGIGLFACKIEINLKKHIKKELTIISITLCINFFLFFFL